MLETLIINLCAFLGLFTSISALYDLFKGLKNK